MIQLACTHCGHRFELEKQDAALCPSCGWSSSVVPAAELAQNKPRVSSKKSAPSGAAWLPGFLFFVLKFLALASLLFLLIWGSIRFWNSRPSRSEQRQNQKVSQDLHVNMPKPKSVVPIALNADESAVLNSKIEIPVVPQLEDSDQKLLQRAIDLTAGNVEKLPSGNWSLEQFKQFIEKQEKVFRMPLPRSYKKSLEDLFQKTYAPAYDLFLSGKIQQARDAYVASVGLPVYDNDVRKHRAIILTMLRSFVNDTIAKIGSLNFALAKQGSNGLAEQAGAIYGGLQQQIRAGQWNEALSSVEKIESVLSGTNGMAATLPAPPYSAGFEKVDADIQPVLLKLLQVPAWTFDLNELKSDLAVKKALLLKLTDPDRKNSLESYNKALDKIQAKAWAEAVVFLHEVKSPQELKQDADQKIVLIEKLTGTMPAEAGA